MDGAPEALGQSGPVPAGFGEGPAAAAAPPIGRLEELANDDGGTGRAAGSGA
ncbi:MAG TPA: hypothetical protein VFO78_04585 [Candidatus Limnocylindrales bacterium]|nr:hypothetical protein [Candidatus Limnocylindrales bacterium]